MPKFIQGLILGLLLLSVPAYGMSRIIEVLDAGIVDDAGEALSAGTVTVYDAGTTNLRTVYSDFSLSTPLSNPFTLDSAGRKAVYTDRRVKLLIKNSGGTTIRTVDNVGTADSDVAAATADASAGDGLTAPGDGTIAVNPDNESLEINSDKVRVKAGGFSQGSGEVLNASCAASVGSSALTISLKTRSGADPSSTSPVTIPFRSSTLTSGVTTTRQVTGALSQVVASGSTLGHTSGAEWPIYVYAIDNAGTVELAYSSSPVDERYLQTTVDEAGNGDSVASFYSSEVRSNVAVKLLCVMKSTQTTAGTWAAVPTAISAPGAGPLQQIPYRKSGTTVGVGGVAISASTGSYTTASTTYVAVTNASVTITTSGRPVRIFLMPDTAASAESYLQITSSAMGGVTSRGWFQIKRGSTVIGIHQMAWGGTGTTTLAYRVPVSGVDLVDFPSAGTYTYTLEVKGAGGGTISTDVQAAMLAAYEL